MVSVHQEFREELLWVVPALTSLCNCSQIISAQPRNSWVLTAQDLSSFTESLEFLYSPPHSATLSFLVTHTAEWLLKGSRANIPAHKVEAKLTTMTYP